jgi:NTE family protein
LNFFWFSAKFENTGYIPLNRGVILGYHYVLHAEFKPLLSNYFSSIIEAPAFQPNLITKAIFMEEYRANQFIGVGLMPIYSFGKNMHAKMEVYGFFPVQEILRDADNNAYLGNYFGTMKTIFNTSVNYLSRLGPIGFNAGYISALEQPWIVQLSFGYLLFNRKSNED